MPPFRRLVNVLARAGDPSAGSAAAALRPGGALGQVLVSRAAAVGSVERGAVAAIGTTWVLVQHGGALTRAVPATDEPLRVGQQVWVTRTRDGAMVVLGVVRA